jgi:hypothetical protein
LPLTVTNSGILYERIPKERVSRWDSPNDRGRCSDYPREFTSEGNLGTSIALLLPECLHDFISINQWMYPNS